jgi:hypothetical protein
MSGSDRRLTVDAADKVAQISVLDGNLNQVAQGVGRLSEALSPGLYKVRVRVGPTTDERLVSLDADRHETFDVQDFPSAVPLHNTSRSHEYHIEAARELSSQPKTVLGSGATIFLFSREWLPPDGKGIRNPAAGLKLFDASGKLLADLEEMAEIRATADPSAGCSIAVAPGEYRLRLDRADGAALERALITVGGWQTQIFMLQRDDGKGRRPDLEGGAVVMSNRGHFEPDDKLTRLSELARYALAQHHKILSDDLQQLLSGKLDDPMLGLFGAHLIIRDMPEDHVLLDTVLDNLEALLGSNHPDVMALTLRRKSPQTTTIKEFHQPPMLRASWDFVVEASFGFPVIVSMGSAVESIGAEVLPNASWLVWRRATAATAVAEEPVARPALIAAVADFTRGPVENIFAGVSQAVGSPVTSPSELSEALKAELAEGTSQAVEAVVAAVGSPVASPSALGEALKVKLAEGTSRAVEAVVEAIGSPVTSPSELREALKVKLAEGASQAVDAVVEAVGSPATSPSELGEALKVKLAEGTSRAVDAVVEAVGPPVTGPSELDEASKVELARSFGMPRAVLEAMLRKLRE